MAALTQRILIADVGVYIRFGLLTPEGGEPLIASEANLDQLLGP